MDPAAFRLHYGVAPPDVAAGARLAAVKLTVRDVAATRAVLAKSGVAAADHMGRLVVGPGAALGATIVFEGP
jgi:hypothetical protein